jgi:hypothetical protein
MIHEIAASIGKTVSVKKVFPMKPTPRCPFQYVCDIDNEGLFLVVIARTQIQKFYFTRSIEKQAEFYPEFKEYYEFNMPKYTGTINNLQYAIYPYFENTTYPSRFADGPLKKIEVYYAKYCKTYEVTEKLIEEVENDFLSAFPGEFYDHIKALPMYDMYFSLLRGMKNLTIGKEHGQYGYGNILICNKRQYLVDFEFSRSFQPVYFDYYDYLEHMMLFSRMKYTKIKMAKMARIKINLVNKMNSIIDQSDRFTRELFLEINRNKFKNVLSIFCHKTKNFLLGH